MGAQQSLILSTLISCEFVPSVGGGSDALIRNLHGNPEDPVPQVVLDPSIKMLAANELGGIGGTSAPSLQSSPLPEGKLADAGERGKEFLPSFGGRKASQPCEISCGVAIDCLSRREVGMLSWD